MRTRAKPVAKSDAALVADLQVVVQKGVIESMKTDALVINHFEDAKSPRGATGAVDKAFGKLITKHLKTGDFKGRFGELAVLYPEDTGAKRVILAGLGKKDAFDIDRARRVSAKVAQRARALGASSVHTVVHGAGAGGLPVEDAAQALVEGAILALYKFDVYKGAESRKKEDENDGARRISRLVIVENDAEHVPAIKAAAARAQIIATSANWARTLGSLSGADARAENIAEHARDLSKLGVKVTIWNKREIEKRNMGALLAVNQGSVHEPRFVVMEHGKKAPGTPTICVVGKGVTFDTGGISIKPGAKMEDMKYDKCGAAAVFGTMRAAALLKLDVHLVGVTPFTDNMPSGSAYKPGDVVTAMNGKTIEVQNTDAEGRMILADALSFVDATYKPDAVVDYATLTGAVVIALGSQASGLMSNNDALADELLAAGERTHERVWRLPLFEEYDEQIKSQVADVKNVGGRSAGSITAAKFLGHFIGDWPWAHLDIAATAWNSESPGFNKDYSPAEATGVGVRLTIDWLTARAKASSRSKK